MLSLRQALLPATLTLTLICGCRAKPSATPAGETSTGNLPVASTTPVANAGTVTGTVSFSGSAPARVPIDMSMDPACAMAKEPNLSEQYIVTKGKLANVFITVRSGASTTTAPTGAAPVVLDQKGCRYTPHVLALQQGGSVTFTNSDPTMHNVHAMPVTAGAQTIDISEQPGASKTVTFGKPEDMMPVRCNNHPWMNAFINVAHFAVLRRDRRGRKLHA